MKFILYLFLTISLVGCSLQSKKEQGKVQNQPNIIFIMTDDHAYQAISAYDTSLIETPNIDRLANEGMLFNKAYVTNSICSPSRAVVLTGKFSHINGLKDNWDVFDSAQVTYPKILQKNGYQTAIVGKWHLKSEPTGFDYWQVLPGQGHYYKPVFRTPEGKITEEGYVTDVTTDKSINWLSNIRDKSKPFMLMLHQKAPHREWLPAQRHLDELTSKVYPEPSSLFDDYKNRGTAANTAEMRIFDHMGLSSDVKVPIETVEKLGFKEFMKWYGGAYKNNLSRLTSEELAKWDSTYQPIIDKFIENTPEGDELTRWKFQRYMQDYLACIKSVDENVGRVLDYLDESGLAENTLVIYTSDQGFYLGEHGWFDKRFMYEESFRTPLIVRWPNQIDAGTTNSELVQNLDFAPTMLTAAGVEVPEDMQGLSLMPLLEGADTTLRDALYYHYYEYPSIHMVKRHYGVKTQRYKLIHFYYDIDEWELYDLETDPKEMNNVYGNPDYADVQAELHTRLEELRVQYGDSDELTQELLKSDLERIAFHKKKRAEREKKEKAEEAKKNKE